MTEKSLSSDFYKQNEKLMYNFPSNILWFLRAHLNMLLFVVQNSLKDLIGRSKGTALCVKFYGWPSL